MVFGEPKVSSKPPETYWSRQQSIAQPKCTFSPDTASDVSTLVLLARLTQCRFAVKSGGHAAFSGASSIKGGITVDLANMKKRKLSADKKIIAIGPGNRWLDVYDHLTPYDLAVVGGRVSLTIQIMNFMYFSDPKIGCICWSWWIDTRRRDQSSHQPIRPGL